MNASLTGGILNSSLLELFIVVGICSVSLILAITVYFSNRNAKINLLFLIMTSLIIAWIGSGYLSNVTQSLWAVKFNVGIVPLLIIMIYFFYSYFSRAARNYYMDFLTVTSGIAVSAVTLFTGLVVQRFKDYAGIAETPMATIYYIWVGFFVLLVISILVRRYFSVNKKNKNQILFFMIGTILFALGNTIFNIIIPFLFNSESYWNTIYYRFGDYSVVFLLGFTAYAIVKQGLFNIKIIATQTTVALLSVGLLVEVFLSNSFTEGLLKGIVWILATYGGYVLIKSVQVEIKQKEQLAKLATRLDEANDHLKELDETKDNFLSMASHELNTPIAAINGYLSMVLEEKLCGNLNADATRYLTQVYTSSKRLASLVKDLLNVSRIESNRIHIIYTEAQIEDVIKQSIGEVAIKAKEVGHKLTFEKPAHAMPKTFMDVPRITEVIINLLGNAIKYTDAPGKIEVSVHADDGKIVVACKDNGRGIPKDKYEHMFEKFTQVNVLKDEVKGTGLGMFISKNLVEMHKGKLWFKSSTDADNHGTTFFFSLPIHKTMPYDPHQGEGALFATRSGAPSETETERLKKQLAKTLGEEDNKKIDNSKEKIDTDTKKIMEAGMVATSVHDSALKAIEKGKDKTEKASTEWS